MNKTDASILLDLHKNNCTNENTGISIYGVMEHFKYSYSTISNSLKSLILAEYVARGLKDGHKETFFITQKGLNKLIEVGKSFKQAKKEVIGIDKSKSF